jgi:hypothetical protein
LTKRVADFHGCHLHDAFFHQRRHYRLCHLIDGL